MNDLPSLDQLRVFVVAAEAGSFSAAGRQVGRVQSAVSHAIAGLESTLGLTLFDRVGRTPQLTADGRRLLSEARLVLAQSRAFHRAAMELRGGTEPVLSVVVDSLFPADRLARALASVHVEFPHTSVRVHWALLDNAVERVRAGHADVGICNVGDTPTDVLVARWLTSLRLRPVCAASHPLADEPAPQSMARLRAWTQIVLADAPADVEAADRGVLSPRTWRVPDVHTKLALLRAGVGWGALPRPMVEADLAAGRLVALQPEPWPEGHLIQMHAVTRADRPVGPAGRRLVAALHDDGQSAE